MAQPQANVPVIKRLKVIVIGDSGVGKTSLIAAHLNGKFQNEDLPAYFDTQTLQSMEGETIVSLEVVDTPGEDEFQRMRVQMYQGAHVAVLCYSVTRPSTLVNISRKWAPEVHAYFPKIPIILVGTMSDLREDKATVEKLAIKDLKPVAPDQAKHKLKEIKGHLLAETSALQMKGSFVLARSRSSCGQVLQSCSRTL